MVCAPFVVEQPEPTTVGRDQHIERAIVINVGVGCAPRDFRAGKCRTHLLGYFLKPSATQIAEQVRRFRVGDALLHPLDFVFNVAVGHENIGPAVVVVIEEEATESQRDQGVAPNLRTRSLVHEEPVALVVVERDHLVREVGDHKAGPAGAVVIRGIHAHAGARHSIFAEGNPRRDRLLLEGPVLLVEVELVGLRVIGEQDVGPTVAVVVENRKAQALRSWIVESGFLGGVFELPAAQVVPHAGRYAFVRFRGAVGLMRAVERAVNVGLRRPLYVIRDHQVEFAVAVVVDPGRAGGKLVRSPKAGRPGHVGEGATPVVVEEPALPQRGNK